MRGYELFKGYGMSQYGFDPIVYGINYARLGLSKTEFVKSYVAEYGEEFFTDFIRGFDNAFNEDYVKDLTLVIIPEIDEKFIMNSLITNKAIRDEFIFGSIEYLDDAIASSDSGKIHMNMRHNKYPIIFDVYLTRHIHADSSTSLNWDIEVNVKYNSGIRSFHKGNIFTIDDIRWCEVHHWQGNDEAGFWYEDRTRVRHSTPHSSTVAKLIKEVTARLVKRYKIDDSSKVTLGDLVKANVKC